ncbi:major tail tube protein [Escherichia coli KTE233]|nr:major tail tube protein [Escherichia coli KTE233]
MAMPRKLKLMNVFLNGYSYQGVAKSVTLPKLTRKLENYRGAGMNGSAPVDLGLDDDALSMEWSLGGFPDSVKEVTKNDARVRYVCFYAPDAATPDHAA